MLELMIDGARVAVSAGLLDKYNKPAPRYTSYPTAPEWSDDFGAEELRRAFIGANTSQHPRRCLFTFTCPFANRSASIAVATL